MKLAINEAKKGISNNHGGPFGAVIVKDGAVIAKGHNEVLKNSDPTCHGEMMAIRKACKKLKSHDLKGCVIYTTGYPCPMCMSAIMWANIDKVYYGCNAIDTEGIGFRDAKFYEMQREDKMKEFVNEIDREACLKLYSDYLELNPTTY